MKELEHILAGNLQVGDYFKYRCTSQIEHYVQGIDYKHRRINEIDSNLQVSSIPFNVYVERIAPIKPSECADTSAE